MGRRSRHVNQQRVRRAEHEELDRLNEERAEEGRRRGCLFCRQSDGGFTTIEHIIPESLGNTGLVLPNGVVCDRCNNGPLSILDKSLCDFMPLKARQIMLGVPAKSGEVPALRYSNGTMTHRAPDNVVINTASGRPAIRETTRVGNRVDLQVNFGGGRRLNGRYASELSSALLKAALEAAWLDHGERTLDSAFDHVRQAVLGAPRDGFFAVTRRGDPEHLGIELQYSVRVDESGREGLTLACAIFGSSMATDSLLPQPTVPFDEDLVHVVTFATSDFKRPKSAA